MVLEKAAYVYQAKEHRLIPVVNRDVQFLVTVHGSERAPPPRNVAVKEVSMTDTLKSATLWGGVGGGETRQIAVPRPSDP